MTAGTRAWWTARAGSQGLGRRRIGTAAEFLSGAVQSVIHPRQFTKVETFLLFLGHVKSGGTLIGALLDAHPNALIADEVDVVRYIKSGFRRAQIFNLIKTASARQAAAGRMTSRRLDPYSLATPGQGRHTTLTVLGSSRAGPTTRALGSDPQLIDRIGARLSPTRLRYVHVVRNPLDPISVMIRRGHKRPSVAIDDYFDQCKRVARIVSRLNPSEVITVRYEELLADPAASIRRVCELVGLEPAVEYLDACTSVIDDKLTPERDKVTWSRHDIASVTSRTVEYQFLTGYRFDLAAETT